MRYLNKNYSFKITLFLILLFFITSCKNSSSKENTTLFSQFPKEMKVSFEKVFEFKNGVPFKLYLIDSTLIIFNERGREDFFFYNYSLENNSISQGYLSGGRGPSQAIGAVSSGIIDGKLWVHDVTLKKILLVDKKDVIEKVKTQTLLFKEYPIKASYYMISFKDSLNYLGTGTPNSVYKIQEGNILNKKINEFGIFENVPENVPFNAYKSAHQSFIYTKPSGDKTVLMYRFSDAIEIYNLESKKNKVIQGPKGFNVSFKPLYTGDTYVMERTKETKFAFVNGTVTNKYIYALYSGKLNESINPHHGKYIYIYDWDGNPIRRITLNKEILCFTVSEDNKMIYGYEADTGYIVKAKIN